MDSVVDSLKNAYQDFVDAAATVLEASDISGALDTAATDTALKSFKQKWELFKVACDQAEEYVQSVKLKVESESLVVDAEMLLESIEKLHNWLKHTDEVSRAL